MMEDAFTRFEHEGWERVADKYDSVWSSLTRQFIPYLIDIGQIVPGMSVLDVACGPGYVSGALRKIGAMPTGIDFSKKMVAIGEKMFPGMRFVQGDAQDLPCDHANFDRVLINFGLLHLSHPEQACVEAFRVLKSGGKFGFTVWAGPEENPGAKIVNDAIEAHADLNVQLPEGPPHYPYGEKKECQNVLARAGFDGNSMIYETRSVQWHLPTATYFFEAERDAGVCTAGLLARQSPHKLSAIRAAIENGVRRYREETNSSYRWPHMLSPYRKGRRIGFQPVSADKHPACRGIHISRQAGSLLAESGKMPDLRFVTQSRPRS